MPQDSPSESGRVSEVGERQHSLILKVAVRTSQSAFMVTDEQWADIRQQVGRIRSGENVWMAVSSVCWGAFPSLLIATTQTGPIDDYDWVTIGIWMGVAATFVGGALSAVAYWLNKKSRENDIESVQSYMDDIKKLYEDVSETQ